jgi:large subunit ribosomal protein L11
MSGKYKGFTVTSAQVADIAKKKIKDLNARDVEHAARIVAGTARSMGITVDG